MDRSLRHPEKARRPDNPSPRKPPWIRVKAPTSKAFGETRRALGDLGLHTVCEEAACPNIAECWAAAHATFMILGNVCTRACAFCNVATGNPKGALNPHEPNNVALATARLGLKHVVVTSVDRDDLDDGGARHFARTITAIRTATPETTIEVLTPDFRDKPGAPEAVIAAGPDVFNHNLETVPRLYRAVRPGARYEGSLKLLAAAKTLSPTVFTKSGIMVGLGEDKAEVLQVMDDLRAANVDFLTIGQYLQPTPKHIAVARFVEPAEFDDYRAIGLEKGFLVVAATPLTRSSYHADRDFRALQDARRSFDMRGDSPAQRARHS